MTYSTDLLFYRHDQEEISMTYRIDLDVAADCPIQEFLTIVNKYSATIVNFESFGPAGGNPNFILDFQCKQNVIDLLTEFYEGDCQHYIDQIQEM